MKLNYWQTIYRNETGQQPISGKHGGITTLDYRNWLEGFLTHIGRVLICKELESIGAKVNFKSTQYGGK